VSEIKDNLGSKTQFSYPQCTYRTAEGVTIKNLTTVWLKKTESTECWHYQTVKKFGHEYNRFDTIPASYRQTDRQTDRTGIKAINIAFCVLSYSTLKRDASASVCDGLCGMNGRLGAAQTLVDYVGDNCERY